MFCLPNEGSGKYVVIGDIIHGDSGPVALNNHFGWLVSGTTKSLCVNHTVSTLIKEGDGNLEYSDNQLMQQDLNKFWDTEAIGIFNSKQETIDQFHNFHWDLYLIGKVVNTKLLFHESQMPNHYQIAMPCVLVVEINYTGD